ncbi:hypothetical protein [Flavobacterium sp.]|jgi:hypothetical protein|uniref:hypothetical protein n=1 Tax=Flavobacterium sp. TaxID=239 RepID=UPI0022BAD9DE|nr:hypothetical protein [Flavobacterium sp.]MCZ8144624.1 hypothetical protein [Flavobacterium sp.]MCZ8368120.1 hypothetical protein [Flavobacterium sp.]
MRLLEKRSLAVELQQVRNKVTSSESFVESFHKSSITSTLADSKACAAAIDSPVSMSNAFTFDLLDTQRIYHESHIKKLCVDYRLRFLDISLFKQDFPIEAIDAIQDLEKTHHVSLQGLKIAAPSKTFSLKNYDDPLLFAPLGNDYYYLIHQWGNDVSPWRKWRYWPIKNAVNFMIFSLVLSALFTWVMPLNKLGTTLLWAPFIVFLFAFKSIVATVAYYFFMMGKNFNSEIWNRPFKEN